MKHGAFSRLFFGLLLTFFSIDIYNLKFYTGYIGALLLAVGVWQLAQENASLKRALRFCAFELALKTAECLLLCLRVRSDAAALILALLGSAAMIGLVYNLFAGLSQLAPEEVSKKLGNCSEIYIIITVLLFATMLFPPLLYLTLPAGIVGMIYMLVQMRRLINCGADAPSERAFRGKALAWLGGYLCVTVLLSVAALVFKSCPAVNAVRYEQNDTASESKASALREKMLNLGYDRDVLAELPDSEILFHEGIVSTENTMFSQSMDSGTVEITKCVSDLGNGRLRILMFYKWAEGPESRYMSEMSVSLHEGLFAAPDDVRQNGFSIFDKQTENGLQTYKADFIERAQSGKIGSVAAKISYRVFGDEAANQRGFFAFDIRVSRLQMELNYNTIISGRLQRSLLAIGKNEEEPDGSFAYRRGFAFDTYQCWFNDSYVPSDGKREVAA